MAKLLHLPHVAAPRPSMMQRLTSPLASVPGAGAVHAVTGLLFDWHQRRRDRQKLSHLDAHLLRDIGLSVQDALDEAEKPFWRA